MKGQRILDIGCGSGERTLLFKNAGCNVIGIDIADTRNRDFKKEGRFLIADAKRLPFLNSTFNAVVSFDVIEHVDDAKLFLKEVYQVCKNGGYIFLGTPNRDRFSNKSRQILGQQMG